MVNIFAGVADVFKVTLVFAATVRPPIVCAGTSVTVVVAPLLKTKISFAAGVSLLGDQFVARPKEALPVWFHV